MGWRTFCFLVIKKMETLTIILIGLILILAGNSYKNAYLQLTGSIITLFSTLDNFITPTELLSSAALAHALTLTILLFGVYSLVTTITQQRNLNIKKREEDETNGGRF